MNIRLVFFISMICAISLNCSQKDSDKNKKLEKAIRAGELALCKELVAAGADVNGMVVRENGKEDREFLLCCAMTTHRCFSQRTWHRPENCLSFLLESKANLNLMCCGKPLSHGVINLPLASRKEARRLEKKGRMVIQLLAAGVDPMIKDKEGRTALDIAKDPLLKALFVCQQVPLLEIGTPKYFES